MWNEKAKETIDVRRVGLEERNQLIRERWTWLRGKWTLAEFCTYASGEYNLRPLTIRQILYWEGNYSKNKVAKSLDKT